MSLIISVAFYFCLSVNPSSCQSINLFLFVHFSLSLGTRCRCATKQTCYARWWMASRLNADCLREDLLNRTSRDHLECHYCCRAPDHKHAFCNKFSSVLLPENIALFNSTVVGKLSTYQFIMTFKFKLRIFVDLIPDYNAAFETQIFSCINVHFKQRINNLKSNAKQRNFYFIIILYY